MPDDKGGDAGRAQKKSEGFRGHSNSSFIVMIYNRVSSRNCLHNSIDGIPVVYMADKIGDMYPCRNLIRYSLSQYRDF